MAKRIHLLVSFFLLLIGIGGTLFFFKGLSFKEKNLIFSSFFKREILFGLFFTLFANLLGALKWRRILKKLGSKVSFLTIFSLYQGALGIMFFIPLLSLPVQLAKAFILEKKFFIALPKSFASIFLDVISEWTVFLFLIFISLLFFLFHVLRARIQIFLFLLSITAILLFGVFLFYYFLLFKKKSLTKIFFKEISDKNLLWQAEKEIFSYFQEKKNFFEIFLFSILKTCFLYLRTLFLVKIFAKNFQFSFSLSLLGLYFLIILIPIPASLGSQEVVQNLLFLAKNFSRLALLTFTFGNRLVDVIVSFLGLFLLIFFI